VNHVQIDCSYVIELIMITLYNNHERVAAFCPLLIQRTAVTSVPAFKPQMGIQL